MITTPFHFLKFFAILGVAVKIRVIFSFFWKKTEYVCKEDNLNHCRDI
jgi:hypothetical protein